MADLLKGFFGGAKSAITSAIPSDVDFADFATAASPTAPSHAASSVFSEAAPTITPRGFSTEGRPYTKWYRIWERVTVADFYQEFFILPVLFFIIIVNVWGTRANRYRAKQWASTHLPMLEGEFAVVGFGKTKTSPKVSGEQGIAKTVTGSTDVPEDLLKEKSKNVYITYASGRQNVAWLDVKVTLYKRYNPFTWIGELLLSFFMDSMPAPVERVEATAYCFDGKEKSLVPGVNAGRDSAYDGFVWAIVHKDKMKQLRDDRYDLSLTSTKDHPKLPIWATVMSESAEVTDALLTPDLIKAVNDAGEDLEALVVSDQPIDAPKTLDDTVPRKRVSLTMRLNTKPSSTSLFAVFLRLPDHLVSSAHFRPEAMRRIKATREDEQRKIRKVDDEEKAEERRIQADKLKKEERDRKLSRMSAEDQKKFLQKERDAEQRKGAKRRTMKG